MTRRPAVTLMEVLIAMFIMAIGTMALMALFPVGAVSMAQALKDDRCAYASIMSENAAIATNVRYGDATVATTLNATASGLVYVDPYAALQIPINPALSTVGGLIPRISPFFITNPLPVVPPAIPPTPQQLTDRWFSLPDDIGFNLSGMADTSNTGPGIIDRGRGYTYAYLLRRQPPFSLLNPSLTMYTVQLYSVVYYGRPINSLTPETTLPAVGAAGLNSITVSTTGTTLKRGRWLLDPVGGYFYRVTNLAENNFTVPPSTTVEIQQNLVLPVSFITIMDNVAEVFDKGTGWQQ